MKKVTVFMMMLSFLITSCGSIESDAEKLAKLKCKAVKLQQKAMSGDSSLLSESKELAQEAAALAMELTQKYNSKDDALKFQAALQKASQNINCN
ncbi:MAG: hypothetical protein AB8B65_12260 [Kordia sp.]|uniref:hypothetical protein n=1 Tax=Kordia sp. TaxID=1965332 RepID=UPI00385D8CB8